MVGTDIAQLLLEGREPSAGRRSRYTSERGTTDSPLPSHEVRSRRESESQEEESSSKDHTLISRSTSDAAVDKFRDLLLLGRKKVSFA